MTIKQFDAATASAILEECRAALQPIADKYGLTLDRKGRTYRPEALPVMFQFLTTELDARGNAMSVAAKDFQRLAAFYGLTPEHLGRMFDQHGERFKIVGLSAQSPKYPILASNVRTGKTFKFPPSVVLVGLQP